MCEHRHIRNNGKYLECLVCYTRNGLYSIYRDALSIKYILSNTTIHVGKRGDHDFGESIKTPE